MIRYRIVVPPELREILAHFHPSIKQKVHATFRVLESNPRAGKPLERELKGYWAYPIPPYRIVYRIDASSRTVFVTSASHRKEVYEILTKSLFVRERMAQYKIKRAVKKK